MCGQGSVQDLSMTKNGKNVDMHITRNHMGAKGIVS
jgi:hypothetical protein